LIFNLGRLDIMPASGLGIRRGVQLVYRLEDVAPPKQVRERRSAGGLIEALPRSISGKIGPGDLN
jgi:3-methyladenine DNA glycosylase/8-oxoguanine DNA glycosylase